MNRLLEKVFERRHYDDAYFAWLNRRDSMPLENIDLICNRLDYYHKTQGLIVLLTDFDMDGLMSGVIGYAGLKELGFNVSLYYPSVNSYGFTEADIDAILSQYPDVKAILTADVGITAFDGIQYAVDHGIEMLVTDHHHPSSVLPNANVIVNPMCDVVFRPGWSNRRQDVVVNNSSDDDAGVPFAMGIVASDDAFEGASVEEYELVVKSPKKKAGLLYFGGICGAHVLYRILHWYAERFCENKVAQVERLRVFAGFATIADSMPLVHENRPLVMDAIGICRLVYSCGMNASLEFDKSLALSAVASLVNGCTDEYTKAFIGLFAVLKTFHDFGKLSDINSIDETFFGFYVAPAFNSVKRMGETDESVPAVHQAYDIFFGDDPFGGMVHLLYLNEARKTTVDEILAKYVASNDADQKYAPYFWIIGSDISANVKSEASIKPKPVIPSWQIAKNADSKSDVQSDASATDGVADDVIQIEQQVYSTAGLRGLVAQRVLSELKENESMDNPNSHMLAAVANRVGTTLSSGPVMVLTRESDGTLVGSGRSPEWFPFLDEVARGRWRGIVPAGHNGAFGVTILGEEYLPELYHCIHARVIELLGEVDLSKQTGSDLTISTFDPLADTDIDVELFEEYLDELELYRPFGVGFNEPRVELDFMPGDAIWTYLGKEKKHIKAVLPHGLVLVCFNQADYFPEKIDKSLMPRKTSILGKLNLNEWNGYRTVQFMGSLPSEMDQRGEHSVMTMLNSDSSDNVIDMG